MISCQPRAVRSHQSLCPNFNKIANISIHLLAIRLPLLIQLRAVWELGPVPAGIGRKAECTMGVVPTFLREPASEDTEREREQNPQQFILNQNQISFICIGKQFLPLVQNTSDNILWLSEKNKYIFETFLWKNNWDDTAEAAVFIHSSSPSDLSQCCFVDRTCCSLSIMLVDRRTGELLRCMVQSLAVTQLIKSRKCAVVFGSGPRFVKCPDHDHDKCSCSCSFLDTLKKNKHHADWTSESFLLRFDLKMTLKENTGRGQHFCKSAQTHTFSVESTKNTGVTFVLFFF